MKQLIFLGEGRNRLVYRLGEHGRYVIKVPKSNYGINDNYHEARIYKEHKDDIISYARCRLTGTFLIMEYVEPIDTWDIPEWAKYVDCGQVGRNLNGKIVAYDYGLH